MSSSDIKRRLSAHATAVARADHAAGIVPVERGEIDSLQVTEMACLVLEKMEVLSSPGLPDYEELVATWCDAYFRGAESAHEPS